MKLRRGGFGEVYKGFLRELGSDVAIKRVARDSRQGKKEYLAKVNIISRLRHRNLVQLAGWCHDGSDLLLVYEYLPHGSLDTHLFGKVPLISWPTRCSIAHGLASGLLYLHEGYEQCVVLNTDFNAKLGDFGLARLIAHGLGMHTTVPSGTWGKREKGPRNGEGLGERGKQGKGAAKGEKMSKTPTKKKTTLSKNVARTVMTTLAEEARLLVLGAMGEAEEQGLRHSAV
ncbi:hypothetical protein Taro_047963 [Colocasia esculenta]|uniref:Protein kinase domain-containing protein n=1 Tax=Colocasia esculenta TaxID=4460 RepID=A0A843X7K2_COLES|nr:hypothetical protein [Colocasia esculenta]